MHEGPIEPLLITVLGTACPVPRAWGWGVARAAVHALAGILLLRVELHCERRLKGASTHSICQLDHTERPHPIASP